MRIHLLEPYRSALIARCVRESLIAVVPPDAEVASAAIRTCGTPTLIDETLQLLVLSSQASMVFTDVGSVPQERGMPHMKLSGLENLGIVDVVRDYPSDIAEAEKARWRDLRDLNELWKLEIDEIDALSPLILAQLEARGKPIHWSLFRLLRAVRLGEHSAVSVIASVIPVNLREAASSILRLQPRLMHEFDLPILMTLQQLRLTTSVARRDGSRIAGAGVDPALKVENVANATRAVWGLVVEELIGEEINFPVPASLRDVISLRSQQEIVDFREFLVPFLDSVLAGQATAMLDLRKNIRSCVKAFKRFPRTQRLARWVAYASLTAGGVEAATGLIGISIGTSLLALGLEALAKQWATQSSWLYLAKAPGRIP